MIERTHPKLSVGVQCRLLSISRSSFYYAPQGETAMNLDLMLLMDKQFLDTPFYGVRKMTWHLQNEGHAVNEKRIRRLMRLMRLMPIYQKPNTSKPAKGHKTILLRKNVLFIGSEEGGEAWAILSSLAQTCKLNNVDFYRYLMWVFEQIIEHRNNVDYRSLLPWSAPPECRNDLPKMK